MQTVCRLSAAFVELAPYPTWTVQTERSEYSLNEINVISVKIFFGQKPIFIFG